MWGRSLGATLVTLLHHDGRMITSFEPVYVYMHRQGEFDILIVPSKRIRRRDVALAQRKITTAQAGTIAPVVAWVLSDYCGCALVEVGWLVIAIVIVV